VIIQLELQVGRDNSISLLYVRGILINGTKGIPQRVYYGHPDQFTDFYWLIDGWPLADVNLTCKNAPGLQYNITTVLYPDHGCVPSLKLTLSFKPSTAPRTLKCDLVDGSVPLEEISFTKDSPDDKHRDDNLHLILKSIQNNTDVCAQMKSKDSKFSITINVIQLVLISIVLMISIRVLISKDIKQCIAWYNTPAAPYPHNSPEYDSLQTLNEENFAKIVGGIQGYVSDNDYMLNNLTQRKQSPMTSYQTTPAFSRRESTVETVSDAATASYESLPKDYVAL
jgi:hypothetical protein